ncbi:hypothetical protein CC2G_011624 [Coprinopsis cinerea AmutBmut pab1-1]|nr:hypothetical protein CC2G_011624 [Coprinopsis cinerea AmutBmut pab1-1]
MSKDRSKSGQSIEHRNFKLLLNSDVRSLQQDDKDGMCYSGVWVRDSKGKDTLINLKPGGTIVLGGGSVGSPAILMRTSTNLADTLQKNGGLHLTDHDIFAATATFAWQSDDIRDKVGAMKLQTWARCKKSKRIALLNVAVDASSFLPRSFYPDQARYTNKDYPKMIAAFILPEPLLPTNTIKLDSSPSDPKKRRDAEPIVAAGRRAPFNTTPEDREDLADLRELTETIFDTMQAELKLHQ